MFTDGHLAGVPAAHYFRQLVVGPMPTADLADLIAFNFLEDIPLKQSLLADCDTERRLARIIEALDALAPLYRSGLARFGADPSIN
jgi:hypothetical protein